MKEQIKERAKKLAIHIIKSHDTIRKTASIYGLSKSTVHSDVSIKLKKIDSKLFEKVKKVLEENFAEKHIRGGEATKHKYEIEKKL